MKWLAAIPALACSAFLVTPAHAEPRGFEASLSLAYSAPFGGAEQTVFGGGSDPAGDIILPNQLNQWFSAAVPLRVAVGWRLPYFFVGGVVQYAWAIPSTSPGAACTPCNGPGSDVIVGPAINAHFLPAGRIDPWVGQVLGIESASFDGTFKNGDGGFNANENAMSIGWIMTWEAGADVTLADHVRGGPFVSAAFGQWAGPDNSGHGWLSAGLRFVFDSTETQGR